MKKFSRIIGVSQVFPNPLKPKYSPRYGNAILITFWQGHKLVNAMESHPPSTLYEHLFMYNHIYILMVHADCKGNQVLFCPASCQA